MFCEFWKNFCSYFVFGYFGLKFFRWLYENYLSLLIKNPIDFKSFGKWAVITGATDGIGKEYAKELAKRGMKIVLISRSLEKLKKVSKEIEETYNVETAVIDVDFTSGPEIYDKIRDRIQGKEIGVLVNNVGIFNTAPDLFLDIPNREKFVKDIISCNITSVPMMCSLVMPQMVQRKKGIVINLTSIAAEILGIGASIYAASKAFVQKFSDDLAAEYEGQGIIIQSVLPGPVATNMTKFEKPNLIVPSAKDYVASVIKTVGYAQNTTGYLIHSIMVLGSNAVQFIFPRLLINIQFSLIKHFKNREIKAGRYQN